MEEFLKAGLKPGPGVAKRSPFGGKVQVLAPTDPLSEEPPSLRVSA
jgi:hypothetical protein